MTVNRVFDSRFASNRKSPNIKVLISGPAGRERSCWGGGGELFTVSSFITIFEEAYSLLVQVDRLMDPLILIGLISFTSPYDFLCCLPIYPHSSLLRIWIEV